MMDSPIPFIIAANTFFASLSYADAYGSVLPSPSPRYSITASAATPCSTWAVYLLVFFFYGKYIRRITESIRASKLILPFSLMLGAAAILSVFCFNATGTTRILFSTYAALLCATMLYAMYMVYEAAHLLYEKQTLRAVAAKQKEQYEISKNNIEYINIKCHDLRKQLDLLRGG